MTRRLIVALIGSVVLGCGPKPAAAPAPVPAPARPAPVAHADAGPALEREHEGSHRWAEGNHSFGDVERWAKVFDNPERDGWQKPDDVVRELRLKPTDKVADLGAGTGYFLSRLSNAVPQGKVFAIDIEPNLVEELRKRAAREHVANSVAILASEDDPKLPAQVNVILVVDTYHHIYERTDYFRRVRARLTPDGRVVIVDFKMGKLPVGPPDEHKIAPEVTKREMEAAGYQQCRSYDGLPYQYVLTFSERC